MFCYVFYFALDQQDNLAMIICPMNSFVQSNVPSDLKIVGFGEGLPVWPVSNIVLHKIKSPVPETIECFANHLVSSFREKL